MTPDQSKAFTETELKPDEYRCDMCQGVYKREPSDDYANAEFKQNFGREVTPDDGIICDDCYKRIMPLIQN